MAAGIDVEPIWASLLAKALEGKDVKELLSNVGSGGGAPAVGGGATAAAGGGAPAEAAAEAKEEKKEEEKEESDDDMVNIGFHILLAVVGFTNNFSFRASVYSTDCSAFVGFCCLAHFLPHLYLHSYGTALHCMPCRTPTIKVETFRFCMLYSHVLRTIVSVY